MYYCIAAKEIWQIPNEEMYQETVISHYSSSQNTVSKKKKTEIIWMLLPISKQKPPPPPLPCPQPWCWWVIQNKQSKISTDIWDTGILYFSISNQKSTRILVVKFGENIRFLWETKSCVSWQIPLFKAVVHKVGSTHWVSCKNLEQNVISTKI